jgi:hypothetical protein
VIPKLVADLAFVPVALGAFVFGLVFGQRFKTRALREASFLIFMLILAGVAILAMLVFGVSK